MLYGRASCVTGYNSNSEMHGRLALLGNAHRHHVMSSLSTNSSDITYVDTSGIESQSTCMAGNGNVAFRATTVRDLERAMKRHLPTTLSTTNDEHTDANANRLRRRPETAKWTSPYHVTSQLLPASDLLRTLHDAAVRRQQRGVICTSLSGLQTMLSE